MERQIKPMKDMITLLDYWRVVWKRKFLISLLVVTSVFATGLYSLFLKDIYSSSAVITPVGGKESGGGGLSTLAQQLGGLPGIAMPGSSSASEIVNLLKSNILKEKAIEKYNLLPVLFPERWDEEKRAWKKGDSGEKKGFGVGQIIQKLTTAIKPKTKNSKPKTEDQNDGSPTTWDGLRSLNKIVNINNNVKNNTITVSIAFHDPEMAAKMVEYLLTTLNDHMRGETKRVAQANRKFLEEQLGMTADPLIRQKIYSLISSQIETSMMSEVKENFAFKVIDPPMVPDIKVEPNRREMVKRSLVVSIFAGLFFAFFLEYINKMRNREEEAR